jgi:hypothetical protein
VVYHESEHVIRQVVPDFLAGEVPGSRIAGLTVQWPAAADAREKRYLVTTICEAIGEHATARTVLGSLRTQVRITSGWSDFVASVEGDAWWLGEIGAVFANGYWAAVFPGSDGVFLHVCANEELLVRLLAVARPVLAKFEWEVIEE